MRKNVVFFILFVCFLFFFVREAYATSLNIKLTLNNTENKVYIPGVGEVLSNSLGTKTYINPPHYYLASYLNNVLYGLVFYRENPISIGVSNTSQNHTLTINQDITNSDIFLVFTKGDWKKINDRMPLIESGEFLTKNLPSFGYGLGLYLPIKFLLKYSNINITGSHVFNKGHHKINIRDMGLYNGKIRIDIKRQ